MDEPTPSEGLLRVRSRLSSKLESDLYFPENRRAATFSSATLRPIIEPEHRGHFCNKWECKVDSNLLQFFLCQT